uniref:Uncharacterized protein n=1 Tax=Palpitomonas bilix TaxID=652834 RepID=A0A7S3DM46_9EUKA|mmetsp:Transcript_42924/g.110817  ORF Transcript_42924/g.110817 Transcript_42924/m.110817 type:complete len:107 (+) Transcript_42924:300-620(+)
MPSTTPQPGQMQQPRSLSASTLPRAQSAGDPMRRRSHDMARTYGFANSRRIDDRQTYLESRFGWRTPVAVRMLGTQYNWVSARHSCTLPCTLHAGELQVGSGEWRE